MSVVSTSQQPFSNDIDLAIKICEGVRPSFSNNTSKVYIELAHKCPNKRPTAKKKNKETIDFWNNSFNNDKSSLMKWTSLNLILQRLQQQCILMLFIQVDY